MSFDTNINNGSKTARNENDTTKHTTNSNFVSNKLNKLVKEKLQ